jgi:hypothetical protein
MPDLIRHSEGLKNRIPAGVYHDEKQDRNDDFF